MVFIVNVSFKGWWFYTRFRKEPDWNNTGEKLVGVYFVGEIPVFRVKHIYFRRNFQLRQ